MTTTADIAAAIVVGLNAESFGESFTATRAYRPQYDDKATETLQVVVIPTARAMETKTRSQFESIHSVQIGVMKRATAGADLNTDGLFDDIMSLCEEIIGWLFQRPQGAGTWYQSEHTVLADPGMLLESRTFLSIIEARYKTMDSAYAGGGS
jgi:hypothetical protein